MRKASVERVWKFRKETGLISHFHEIHGTGMLACGRIHEAKTIKNKKFGKAEKNESPILQISRVRHVWWEKCPAFHAESQWTSMFTTGGEPLLNFIGRLEYFQRDFGRVLHQISAELFETYKKIGFEMANDSAHKSIRSIT